MAQTNAAAAVQNRLQDPGAEGQDPLHAPVPPDLPDRRARHGAGHRRRSADRTSSRTSAERRRSARPVRPVHRRPAVARDGVRARHHAVHLGQHLPPDRRRGDAAGREDAEGRGRAGKRSTSGRATPPSALAAVQAWGFALFTESLPGRGRATRASAFRLQMAFFLTTGAIFVMWLGEQITERGIGNGASAHDLLLDRRAHLAGHRARRSAS